MSRTLSLQATGSVPVLPGETGVSGAPARMPRWFLSYNSRDQTLAERLRAAIERKNSASRVFFAPQHNRAGGFWTA
jgi:hypothetical protein